jgi:WD40 repeat protein
LIANLYGHESFIIGLFELADGNLVTVSERGCIITWNIKTGEPIKTIKPKYAIYARYALLLPNEKVAFIDEKRLLVCDQKTGELRGITKPTRSRYTSIWSYTALSNNHIAIGYGSGTNDEASIGLAEDKIVEIVDLENGQVVDKFSFESSGYALFLLSLPNEQMAMGTRGHIYLYQPADTENRIKKLNCKCKAYVWHLALLDESTIASSFRDEPTIEIWNFTRNQALTTLTPERAKTELALLKKSVLASCAEKKLQLWNWESGQLLKTLQFEPEFDRLISLKKSGYLVTAKSKLVQIWNVTV